MARVKGVWSGKVGRPLDCTCIEAQKRRVTRSRGGAGLEPPNRAKLRDARARIQVTTDCQQCCRGTLPAMGTAVNIMGGPDYPPGDGNATCQLILVGSEWANRDKERGDSKRWGLPVMTC